MSIFLGNLRRLAASPDVVEAELASMFDVSPSRMDILLHEAIHPPAESGEGVLPVPSDGPILQLLPSDLVNHDQPRPTGPELLGGDKADQRDSGDAEDSLTPSDPPSPDHYEQNKESVPPDHSPASWSVLDGDKVRACVVELLDIVRQRVLDPQSWMLYGRHSIPEAFERELASARDSIVCSSGAHAQHAPTGDISASLGLGGPILSGGGQWGGVAQSYRCYRSMFARLLRLLLLDELAAPASEEGEGAAEGDEFWRYFSVLEYGPQRMRLTKILGGETVRSEWIGPQRMNLGIRSAANGSEGIGGENVVEEWVPREGGCSAAQGVPRVDEDVSRRDCFTVARQSIQDAFLLHSCPLSVRFVAAGRFFLGADHPHDRDGTNPYISGGLGR